jgi:ClpX C4-type zinc finger
VRRRRASLRCAFCGKRADEVEALYGKRVDQGYLLNPKPPKEVFICDECIDLFHDHVLQWRSIKPGLVPGPEHAVRSAAGRTEESSTVLTHDPDGCEDRPSHPCSVAPLVAHAAPVLRISRRDIESSGQSAPLAAERGDARHG